MKIYPWIPVCTGMTISESDFNLTPYTLNLTPVFLQLNTRRMDIWIANR
jgi:hypothetical protein